MVKQETYMAISPMDLSKYQQVSNYSFGGLTSQRGQQIQGRPQGVEETNPMSNPFTVENKEELVGRLDKIDASTITPNTQDAERGQNLYLIA